MVWVAVVIWEVVVLDLTTKIELTKAPAVGCVDVENDMPLGEMELSVTLYM